MSTVEKSDSLSRSTYVRRMVLRNPEANLEQVQEAWVKNGNSEADSPKMHDLHVARSFIRRKYKVDDIKDIPRKPNGELNTTGVLRLILKNDPDMDLNKARRFVESDGITFSDALWSVMRYYDKKKAGKKTKSRRNDASVETSDSPDENQNAGPRARRKARRGRKPGSGRRGRKPSTIRNNETQSVDLLKIEATLDQMIQTVQDASFGEMARALREARRHVSKGILNAGG